MATEKEIDILAREALHLVEREDVLESMAKQSVLNAHKDIRRTDGIMKAIGVRMSEIRTERKARTAAQEQVATSTKKFATFAERSLPKEKD